MKVYEERSPKFNAVVTGSRLRREGIWRALKPSEREKVKQVHKKGTLYIVKLNKGEVKIARRGTKFSRTNKAA